jgi:lysyl-tRNA synthetase class 2
LQSNLGMTNPSVWMPACSPEVLRLRAGLLAAIRRYFAERGVLEVETPLLCGTGVTDPNLHAFTTRFRLAGERQGRELYLQTSPEFAMKRLLAAGSGSIYQICKAFRNEESGRHHNPEFTLLEWYRVGFSLSDLMDEVNELFTALCGGTMPLPASERFTYSDIFRRHLGLDPLGAGIADFAEVAAGRGLPEAEALCGGDRAVWLDLLFSHFVQPQLGRGRVSFVYDYPASLPSLARKSLADPRVVARVEVFLAGLELGNGFHELADAEEQEARFEVDLASRRERGLPLPPKDECLLAALRAGFPDCSGVAIGVDRLLMVLSGMGSIGEVLAFPIDRA